jgi:hypothetical protein
LLRALVAQHGSKNWKLVAQSLSKKPEQCLHRWNKVLNPSLTKGLWTPTEDASLLGLVEKHGPKRWSLIAQHLEGRNGKQCRERWHNHLDPSICKDPFTAEEDAILLTAHAKLGNRWAEISQMLEGRTDNAVKNRWHSSLKKCVASGESPTAAPSPNRRKRKLSASKKRAAKRASPGGGRGTLNVSTACGGERDAVAATPTEVRRDAMLLMSTRIPTPTATRGAALSPHPSALAAAQAGAQAAAQAGGDAHAQKRAAAAAAMSHIQASGRTSRTGTPVDGLTAGGGALGNGGGGLRRIGSPIPVQQSPRPLHRGAPPAAALLVTPGGRAGGSAGPGLRCHLFSGRKGSPRGAAAAAIASKAKAAKAAKGTATAAAAAAVAAAAAAAAEEASTTRRGALPEMASLRVKLLSTSSAAQGTAATRSGRRHVVVRIPAGGAGIERSDTGPGLSTWPLTPLAMRRASAQASATENVTASARRGARPRPVSTAAFGLGLGALADAIEISSSPHRAVGRGSVFESAGAPSRLVGGAFAAGGLRLGMGANVPSGVPSPSHTHMHPALLEAILPSAAVSVSVRRVHAEAAMGTAAGNGQPSTVSVVAPAQTGGGRSGGGAVPPPLNSGADSEGKHREESPESLIQVQILGLAAAGSAESSTK